MDQQYFERLKSHGAMLAIARQLLDSGLATPDEYHKIKSVLSRKKMPGYQTAKKYDLYS